MTTTFEAWPASRRVRNYSSRPTIDVEILPDRYECQVCAAECVYVPKLGNFVHADDATPAHEGRIAPKPRCPYCHSTEHLTYTAHAWHDAAACSRCGGIDGFAIGD